MGPASFSAARPSRRRGSSRLRRPPQSRRRTDWSSHPLQHRSTRRGRHPRRTRAQCRSRPPLPLKCRKPRLTAPRYCGPRRSPTRMRAATPPPDNVSDAWACCRVWLAGCSLWTELSSDASARRDRRSQALVVAARRLLSSSAFLSMLLQFLITNTYPCANCTSRNTGLPRGARHGQNL